MAFGNRYFTDFEDTYYDLFGDMYGGFPNTPISPLNQFAPAPAETDYFANQFADDFKQTPASPLASVATESASFVPQSFIDAEQRAYEDQQMVYRDSQARIQALAEQQAEAERQSSIAAEAARRQAIEDAFYEQQARAQAEQQAETQRQAQLAQQQAEAQRQAELAEQARQAQLAEQRAYEDQQRAFLENQARQEAARVAAEQEAARLGALQQAEAQRVAAEQEAARVAAEQEVARQGALQQAESARRAELAQQAEAARLAAIAETPVTSDVPASRSLSASAGALERATSELGDSRDDPMSRIDSLDRRNAESVARTEASQTPEDKKNIEIANNLATQILGQKLTDKWTGQGFGSAEANARDMGKILASIGITDIKQFGPITREVDVYVGTDDSGNPIYEKQIEKTFGNKETGQAVPNTYSERQTGNFFGGTFEGKGNTGYGVQFDAQGNPYFYTQGASSNDLANLMQDLGPLGQIAIAVATGGLSIPQQIAANMAIQVLSGKDIGDAIKGAAISYAGAQIPGLDAIKEGTSFLNGIDSTGVLANAFQNAAVSGGSALLSGRDVGDAMMKGAITGGTSGAVSALMGSIDGFKDLSPAQKNMAINAVTGVISGQPLDQIVINTAIAAANNAIAQAKNENTVLSPYFTPSSDTTSTGAGAFVQAKQAGATDVEALIAANTVTGTSANVGTSANTPEVDTTATGTQATDTTATGTQATDTSTVSTPAVQPVPLTDDEVVAQRTRLAEDYARSLGKDIASLSTAEVDAFINAVDKFTAGGTGVLKTATLQDLLSGNSTYNAAELLANSTTTEPFKTEIRGVGNRGDATDIGDIQVQQSNIVSTLDDLTKWANSLEGPEADTIRQLISTTTGLFGEQLADLGTAISQTGLVGRYNALVQLGLALERTGTNLEIPGVTEATKNFWDKIQSADTYGDKLIAALTAMKEQPLALVNVVKEVGQEGLPLLLGGVAWKLGGPMLGLLTDMSTNALESMGSSNRQSYNEEIAKGTPPEEAERIAANKGIIAGAITMATAGMVDASLIKGYEKAVDRLGSRFATGVAKEYPQEGFEELAIALATGDDLATALSKSIAGSVIGGKTSGTISSVSGSNVDADDEVRQAVRAAFAEQGLTSTDGTFRPDTIAKISDTTPNAVTGGANTVAGTDFSTIFLNTGDLTQAINTSIGSAISGGADPSVAIASVINAANSVGANPNTVAVAAANAAITAGTNATTASNAAANAAKNATATTAPATVTTAPSTATTAPATVTTAPSTATTAPATVTTAPSTTTTAPATVTTAPATVTTAPSTATATTPNAASGVSTSTTTDPDTGSTTTINSNSKTGIDTNIVQNPDTDTTNKTVTNTNTDVTVSVNIDDTTGEVVSINGPGTVIDKDTVVVDGTPIDVNTGEILPPEEVEKRKKAAVKKTPVSSSRPPSGSGNLTFTEPTYAAKKSDIAETWLGGRFRNIAPLAGLGALLPQDSPMFQEAQAISALRRASGIDNEAKPPEADYYAYGTEPSFAKVLEPFMNGGTVQKYAEGGKIMASPLMAASGGDVPHKGSHYVQGAGGGQDDLIPAQLADGEYVFDADIVAALGDGSNKEGAKKLDAMREAIRKHKRGGSIKSIPPAAKSPLAYLKGVL